MSGETQRVNLSDLVIGETVHVTAGENPEERYKYSFTVLKQGEMPLCELVQQNPDSSSIGPAKAILKGVGRWTTPRENPMQRADWFIGRPTQDKAMTIGYGVLYLGGYLIISEPGNYTGDVLRLEPTTSGLELGSSTPESVSNPPE